MKWGQIMLRPSKHSHPDQTVMSAAFLILRSLKKSRIERYDDLLATLRQRLKGADYLFLPALDLLYLLGLIEYRAKSDAFEYVGN